MEDNTIITLEVAMSQELIDTLNLAAHRRGQTLSEFMEKSLTDAAKQAMAEPAVNVTDDAPSNEEGEN